MTSKTKNCPKQYKYDHVVVVVLENHGYHEIIGSKHAPYINHKLAKEGVLITNAYGEQHPSQPNYFWLFSGSNQGIYSDSSYWPKGSPGPVFETPNLYTALESTVGKCSFFGGFVDSPVTGDEMVYYPDNYAQYEANPTYANRHVPWLGFKNINSGNPAGITKNFENECKKINGLLQTW